MITLSSADLNTWIASLLWPLTRILGLITIAPVFGNISVPFQVKIGLGILLALIIAPTVPALPAADPMSLAGLLILTQEFVIGLAMGFAMRIIFAAVEMAGEIVGLTMGFGFATFFDPNTQGRSSAISQFLALLMIMMFLATNMHLALLSALAESFTSLPISASAMGTQNFLNVANAGGKVFSSGVQISLPIVAALLITNVALGILTRAAPQLNLFGIGFPITLGVGFIMIALILPFLSIPLDGLFHDGMQLIRQLGTAVAPSRP
jgi:flagellar biosynthetic protein FliR